MKRREIDWAEQARRADRHEAARVTEIVDNMLATAVELKAKRVLITKKASPHNSLPSDDRGYPCSSEGRFSYFTIHLDFGDRMQEVCSSDLGLWQRIILRLIVVANAVDYGARMSVNHTFSVDIEENRAATFLLAATPNPFLDHEVVIEVVPPSQP